jgi:hypothetical protein
MDRRLQTSLVALAIAGLTLGACDADGDLAAPGGSDVTETSSAIVVDNTNTTENRRYWGDFNGDGRDDLIIVTAGGSYEYLGLAGGGFTPTSWVRNDLTLGHVAYVPGKFHGAGTPTDLLIITAGGTYEYQGLAGGGFTRNVWVRTDLKLGQVQYTAGDWDADGNTDLIITTAADSSQYMGRGDGTFTADTWVRTGLTLGNVKYTVCHFGVQDDVVMTTSGGSTYYQGNIGAPSFSKIWQRTDLKLGTVALVPGEFSISGGDLFVTTASGTSLFQGVRSAGFTPDAYVRSDWKLGQVKLTVGHFIGGGDSFIVTVASGSYEYTSNSNPDGTFNGFNRDLWVRHDLPLGTVDYFVGHFTDGGYPNDMIIMTAGGSYEYLGNYYSTGGFTANAWVRNDLPLGSVQYF